MKKLKKICKEYQKLSFLLINVFGKRSVSHQIKKKAKKLKQITKQQLLVFYIFFTIMKK